MRIVPCFFRGVQLCKNANVKNCVILQDCVIGEGVELEYVILDKEVVIHAGGVFRGTPNHPMIFKKERSYENRNARLGGGTLCQDRRPRRRDAGAACGAGQLPGNELALFLPYYKRVKENPNVAVDYVGSFHMELAWRDCYVGIMKLRTGSDGLNVYFIDNNDYFGNRWTVYGDFDDGERFAYFCKAAMAAMYFLDFKPDILHCHDWQSAMGVVYCRALYNQWCPYVKTVFTIHNVEYQGWAESSFFDNTLGLPEEYRGRMTFDGAINMMKGAIVTADIVTTVSQTLCQRAALSVLRTPSRRRAARGVGLGHHERHRHECLQPRDRSGARAPLQRGQHARKMGK